MKKFWILLAVLTVIIAMYLYVRTNSGSSPVKSEGVFVNEHFQ